MRTAGKTDKIQRMEREGIREAREKFKRERMINDQMGARRGTGGGVHALSVNWDKTWKLSTGFRSTVVTGNSTRAVLLERRSKGQKWNGSLREQVECEETSKWIQNCNKLPCKGKREGDEREAVLEFLSWLLTGGGWGYSDADRCDPARRNE